MDNIYPILVIVLFALAFSDLIVGVSNDAVNFLNSALGSNAAPRYVIMIVASLGIFLGATFSSGMMEVARKGIFHPEHFYFSEIIVIFLSVMIADVILLDLFNTFGMPTSTTVSIVFELLGAAVAVSILKIMEEGGKMSEYINSEKAMLIIAGILLSIVIAFTVGTIVQYLTRIIFTFDYEKYMKYFGAAYGSLAITAIIYFIIIKGAKGSSLISEHTMEYIKNNTMMILTASFATWLLVLQIFILFTRINIFRIIVLVGTFALAMAFAGNDLVNFVGVPLAGYKSYQAFMEVQGADAARFTMEALNEKVMTDGYFLELAGLIMVITLWFSKKAKSVTETTINLSRQDTGYERFGSSTFSRNLVRGSMSISRQVERIIPRVLLKVINNRFNDKIEGGYDKDRGKPSFDLIRASVNLSVASILIAFATSLKLPLSTTYVTFMVAMGTSFGDGAWGRESAVYRVSGVTSVIGGWFLTAFAAFTAAFGFAYLIHYGGPVAIGGLIFIAILFVVKTHALHKKKLSRKERLEKELSKSLLQSDVLKKNAQDIIETLAVVSRTYGDTLQGLAVEDRTQLKATKKEVAVLNKNVKRLKNNIYLTINRLREDFIETGHYHVQVLDYLREMAHCLTYISSPAFEHIDNNHKGLYPEQIEEFEKVKNAIFSLFSDILTIIRDQSYDDIKLIVERQQIIIDYIGELNRKQVKRINKGEAGTKNSLLYLGILTETKNLLHHAVNLVKAQRDFIVERKVL